MRIGIMARHDRDKIHFVGVTVDDEHPRPAPGDRISGRAVCSRHPYHDVWVVVDQRALRDLPDGGESLMCRGCG